MQNAAVLVVVAFFRCIDANQRFERDRITVSRCCRDGNGLGVCIRLTCDVVAFFAGQTERLGILTIKKLQWQYAHTDQVGTVNTLKAFHDDGFDTEQQCALGGPVAR